MCAAGLLLLNLGYTYSSSETSSYSSSTSSSSGRQEITGWMIVGFLFIHFWRFLKAPFVQISGIGETAFRGEWWATCIRALTYGFVFYIIPIEFLVEGWELDMYFVLGGLVLVAIALFWVLLPMVLVSIRRVRDAGRAWWWALIPLVNIVICGFFPTKTEGNPYI